jgi:macrolide transport system ATP-binding/permease protein
LFEHVLRDIRFALRQLRKSPGFTLTAVVVLALGIAASTTIFAFVDVTLVKPLPYREPTRLVALFEGLAVGHRYHLSYGDYLDWKHLNHTFVSLDVYRPDRVILKTPTGAEEVATATVSDGFFHTLGVRPFLGRDFNPGEDLTGAPPTVILSYETWRNRFAASQAVLGQTAVLDGTPATIIGVLPAGFHFAPVVAAGFWITLHSDVDPRNGHPYYGVGRLKQGVALAAAYEDLAAIAQRIAIQYPRTNRDRTATVLPLTDLIVGNVRPTLVALLCGSALLSLIGFANVSSLLLVRAERRKREIAVRGALGASRARLVRQFAVEGFLLAAVGFVLALLLAFSFIGILTRLIPPDLFQSMPYLEGLHFGGALVIFAMVASICGGVLFSASPALQLFLADMQEGLMDGGRTASGRTWRRVGSSLVVVELAITVVLLVSAGLLAKSFYRLLHEDIGMAADHLAVLHVSPQVELSSAGSIAMERKIRNDMAALPGVIAVGDSEQPEVQGGEGYVSRFAHFKVVGRAYLGQGDEAVQHRISVGYFETLRVRLLRGRFLMEEDHASRTRVALINRTMAQQVFPGEEVLGKTIVNEFYPDPVQIIGVVDDIKDGPLDAKPTPAVYIALKQEPTDNLYVTVRTAQSEEAILTSMVTVIHQIDPGLIVNEETTMTDRINNSESAYLHRCAAWIVAAFASLALLLGTVGLYGVISYSIGQRTREIGVRIALGAQRSSVYQLILTEACWLAVLGIVFGVFGSLAATRLLRSMLFAVSPQDATTMIGVAALLGGAAILASYVPARRAASINPTEALRAE